MATSMPVTLDTPITIKVAIQGTNRKFKVPLKDLQANVLLDKLRTLLQIPADEEVVFERFSDSAGTYVVLDPGNTQVFKTLYRAAKAKLKLRLRATLPNKPEKPAMAPKENSSSPPAFPRMARPVSMSVLNTPSGGLNSAMTSTTTLNDAASLRKAARYRQLAMQSQLSLASEKAPTTASRPTGMHEAEAPLPRPFIDEASTRDAAIAFLRNREPRKKSEMPKQTLPVRPKSDFPTLESLKDALPSLPLQSNSWSVYCNACDKVMANEHYHCDTCDEGDYDLCAECVNAGIHCPGQNHWLVKRFVKQGKVVSSTTERVGFKPATAPKSLTATIKPRESLHEMPGAFKEDKKSDNFSTPTRTCNSCVREFPENSFVHCKQCDDYDLCMPCHVGNRHGHHPGHEFAAATADTHLGPLAEFLCPPGRNVRHQAVCDGCDKFIFGARYKCLDCPDWDLCSQCNKSASEIHPTHRFAPIYDPLEEPARSNLLFHYGIYCDGPLCKDNDKQGYIRGIRFKCAVCHDTDFCGNCEASPQNKHNPTHPLIKMKTPIRNILVSTINEEHKTNTCRTFGDIVACAPAAGEKSTAEKSPVKTIVDIKPSADAPPKPAKEKIEIRDLLTDPVEQKLKIDNLLVSSSEKKEVIPDTKAEPKTPKYDAEYVRDTIADGTKVTPSQRFTQIWVLRNPGPSEWPAGCSVKYVGGDNMLNVDTGNQSTEQASESQTIRRTVKVGEEVAFSVVMKAPKRNGTAISYWRLKSPDGTPFGHRLWCHVDVVNRNPTVEDVPETSAVPPVISSVCGTRPRSVNFSADTNNNRPAPRMNQPFAAPHPSEPTTLRRPVSMMPMSTHHPSMYQLPSFSSSNLQRPNTTYKVFDNGTEVQHIENVANVRSPSVPPRMPTAPVAPAGPAPVSSQKYSPFSTDLTWNTPPGYSYVPYRPGAVGPYQSGNHALQDYQLQMMLLEQQNKKRLLMAREEKAREEKEAREKEAANKSTTDSKSSGSEPQSQMNRQPSVTQAGSNKDTPMGRPVSFDQRTSYMNFQRHLKALEQQSKERIAAHKEAQREAREKEAENKTPSEVKGSTEQDYQIRLKALEQKNRERLLAQKEAQWNAQWNAQREARKKEAENIVTTAAKSSAEKGKGPAFVPDPIPTGLICRTQRPYPGDMPKLAMHNPDEVLADVVAEQVKERRERALEMLTKMGLESKMQVPPNTMKPTEESAAKPKESEPQNKLPDWREAAMRKQLQAIMAAAKDARNERPKPPTPPAPKNQSVRPIEEWLNKAKIETPKPKVESPKVESSKTESVKAESPKPQPIRVESPKPESDKSAESTMIFPTLEKESPTSSTHEAAVTAPSSVKAASEAAPSSPSIPAASPAPIGLMSPSTVKSEPEIFEDAESVDLSDASFLTDEEYDILDASDEESI